jgi:histidine ammonia-lyase
MGFEDHVSMGSISALKLTRVLDNVARVVAVELLCGAQAIDFHAPLKPGKGTKVAHSEVRARVPFTERDTSLTPYIAILEAAANSGEILAAIEKEIGPLLPRNE